jgi:hypothetical protein
VTEGSGNETPDAVLRLLTMRDGSDPFLRPHHAEAARRLARLCERARMRQRVTMSYDPARTGGKGAGSAQADLAQSAADARQVLNRLARQLPADCWSVLIDVCGFEKGLQQIEVERSWPRRGAKLVLRIALDQLCAQFGLAPHAQGSERLRMATWIESRPPMFPDDAG